MIEAQSLWHIDNRHSILKKEQFKNSSNEIVLKARFSLISTGTERLVANGNVPVTFEKYMSVPYMSGNFSLPIKYGYSMIALSPELGPVHVMHPHQDIVKVDQENVYPIDQDIPLHRLALISNIETVINAIWDANINKEDKIAICGFGNIGALLANTLRERHDIETSIIETDSWRQAKAKSLGWQLHNPQENYSLIFHTSCNERGLQYCIDHLSDEGRVIELSWYGDKQTKLNLGHAFHYKRLQLISSQVSVIPKKMRGDFDYKKRKDLAVDILKASSFDKLIAEPIPFAESPQFFEKLRMGHQGDGLIWIIKYD